MNKTVLGVVGILAFTAIAIAMLICGAAEYIWVLAVILIIGFIVLRD